jgi:hypothetical protein
MPNAEIVDNSILKEKQMKKENQATTFPVILCW